MNQGKYIFAQIMELVSYKQFQLYYTKSQNTGWQRVKEHCSPFGQNRQRKLRRYAS